CLSEDVGVSCSPQTVCALRGSAAELRCSYPANIKTVFWFSHKQKARWRNEEHPEDLASDSDYTGRVNTESRNSNSALTIRDLRETDSGEYHLMIITERGQNYFSPAVTVTVTGLQLEMTHSGQEVNLSCSTSCSLTSKPEYYYWHKNEQYTRRFTPYSKPQPLVLSRDDAGSYSCSINSREHLHSSTVGVFIEDSKMDVSYTEGQISVVEGLSVEFPCTYSYPKSEWVNKAFWIYFQPEVESEDLSVNGQFAGRVEFIGDKERTCTLRIRDVRERDSGEYRFHFSTQSGVTVSRLPGVTLRVTEESSVLKLVAVGVVVFLALILITAALCMCCVIRRKRGAQRDTDVQTPNPADLTYTALNPTTMSSDYDTLHHLTGSPSDAYTALNPATMCSDYDTLIDSSRRNPLIPDPSRLERLERERKERLGAHECLLTKMNNSYEETQQAILRRMRSSIPVHDPPSTNNASHQQFTRGLHKPNHHIYLEPPRKSSSMGRTLLKPLGEKEVDAPYMQPSPPSEELGKRQRRHCRVRGLKTAVQQESSPFEPDDPSPELQEDVEAIEDHLRDQAELAAWIAKAVGCVLQSTKMDRGPPLETEKPAHGGQGRAQGQPEVSGQPQRLHEDGGDICGTSGSMTSPRPVTQSFPDLQERNERRIRPSGIRRFQGGAVMSSRTPGDITAAVLLILLAGCSDRSVQCKLISSQSLCAVTGSTVKKLLLQGLHHLDFSRVQRRGEEWYAAPELWRRRTSPQKKILNDSRRVSVSTEQNN
ncbi:hypothetical protein NFI96_029119, partial [Prochilodus magdalenae]